MFRGQPRIQKKKQTWQHYFIVKGDLAPRKDYCICLSPKRHDQNKRTLIDIQFQMSCIIEVFMDNVKITKILNNKL